ncbi:TonB-dependent receptor [Rubrivivax sp. A210]|uniref:TonB-dependent receptor n=1 Tax=Rubrivivax sp. A210 TaxID=2772301 RepID=UPI001918BD77|nr:TonB-dependent receptor [Rubrivivax sp. A210]CAD5375137.1 TonB-dependent receptor [Rubrivivax sp. A210]
MTTRRRAHPFLLGVCAQAALLALHGPALAQTTQKVEITGSAIKRIDAESALPVQVITRGDIDKAGVTTAAELMATISASANNLTDGVSIGTGGFKDQMGFNSANLRGLGTSSTLVLLNGRRMANFASPGDDSGVDLNNIPAAAIERVEILLDGASALYGTDAIGGVMNFITRKDYRGAQVDAHVSRTGESGGGKRTASVAAGFGNVASDGFNVFGVFDVQKSDALRTSQRQFVRDLRIPERLPHLLSDAPFPGNIVLTAAQRAELQAQDFRINGQAITGSRINFAAPGCTPPHSLNLAGGIGGVNGCTYDFMGDLELAPKSDKLGLLARAVWQLAPEHQLFGEISYSDAKTLYVGTSNRVRLRGGNRLPTALIPQLAAALPGQAVEVQARLLDAGNRTSELTSTGTRLVLGASGTLAGWDYDAALNHSVNKVSDRDVRGYLLFDGIIDGARDGTVNLFGPQTAAGLAYLEGIQVNDEVRSARGSMTALDVKGSKSLFKIAGGDLALALGAELRREKARSRASELLLSDNILGDDTPGDAQTTDQSRRVWAVYGEINAPLTKQLELQLSLRHDQYDKIGGTTNPKIGLRWTPSPALLLRASAGSGFRAPSLTDLSRPTKVGGTSILPDPVFCGENGGDLGICASSWETRTFANPDLKPERSRQFSLGLVLQASERLSFSIDYWNIAKRDLISTLGDDVILANLGKYEGLVHRFSEDEGLDGCDLDPADNTICFIELRKENRGRQKASGLDLMAELKPVATPLGRVGGRLQSTLALSSRQQTGYGDPYVSNLGKFVTNGVVQRWRHRVTADWAGGPWALSLTNSYHSGYDDQNSAIDTGTGTVIAPNRVKAYSLWDLSASWSPSAQLTLRGGIKNLGDTAPPFSNQGYFFISGYDPSYTDPRGRSFYLGATYAFQ